MAPCGPPGKHGYCSRQKVVAPRSTIFTLLKKVKLPSCSTFSAQEVENLADINKAVRTCRFHYKAPSTSRLEQSFHFFFGNVTCKGFRIQCPKQLA